MQYQKERVDSVVRLMLTLELGAEEPVLRSIAGKAAAEDLMKLKAALEDRVAEMMPVVTQLGKGFAAAETLESGFMI